MFRVGLTGGIGSGKSTAASFFSDLGIAVIYLDQLSRDIVAKGTPALKKIVDHFGTQVLEDGSLNRQALRSIIFDNDQERIWLESLLHPLIRERQNQLVSTAKSPYVIIEIPLLTENNLVDTVDRVLVIDLPEQTQIVRTAERDASNESEVEAILKIQASRQDRLNIADDVIENDGSLEDLKAKVQELHRVYLELASN